MRKDDDRKEEAEEVEAADGEAAVCSSSKRSALSPILSSSPGDISEGRNIPLNTPFLRLLLSLLRTIEEELTSAPAFRKDDDFLSKVAVECERVTESIENEEGVAQAVSKAKEDDDCNFVSGEFD